MRRPGERRVLSVSEVSDRVKDLLETGLGDVWVQGEVSSLVRHSSGHWYFSLKDERSNISAVMFKFQNAYLRFRPEEGMEVLCRGKVTAYAPRSSYQIKVEWMEPVGLGALHVEFERLKNKLSDEGLFDQARKRPVPSPLRRIAIITSDRGAALFDMLRVLAERDPGIEVLLVPSPVQGEGAAERLAAALETANLPEVAAPARGRPLEAVILARGGGSLEDLWAFNEEVLARAIFVSRLPVVSAVGHEIDFTIADFVADVRAATPTAAAELVSRGRAERIQRLDHAEHRMVRAMAAAVDERRAELKSLARALTDPGRRIREREERLNELAGRAWRAWNARMSSEGERLVYLGRALRSADPRKSYLVKMDRLAALEHRLARAGVSSLAERFHRIESAAGRLMTLSPRATLERGYAIARDREGRVLKSAEGAAKGDELEVLLCRGSLDCEVTAINPEEE